MIERGTNTKDRWNNKHIQQYHLDEPYDFNLIKNSEQSYHKIAGDILLENKDCFNNKSMLEIGCAGGYFCAYVKSEIIPDFSIEGWDFSPSGIQSAIKRAKDMNLDIKYEEIDFILNPIENDYGIICMFETIEHVAEGKNYDILNNILEHCEYAIISTVTTPDDCFGEHISHYDFDTFENKGYNVIWKTKLTKINLSNIGYFGDYYYVIFLLKGKDV